MPATSDTQQVTALQQQVAALQQQVAALEAELARVRPLEAAAREAHAFFAGRRPGFAHSYPRDVILAAFEGEGARPGRRPPPRAGRQRRSS